jgi:DNA-directed RNA polymerase
LVQADKDASGQSILADTTDADLPAQWLAQGIDRKLCKRGTMTYCYGVTPQGLKDALVVDGFVDWAEKQYSATQYIGKKIWEGILECITGAADAMDWLRLCASCANKADVLLQWRTPSGFHVAHPYRDPQEVRIQCLSGDCRFKVYDPEAKVSKHKQRNSLPPNFVHSLDASHLIMTVAACYANDITHFMMIHDSFGTHACQVDLLRDILRAQFVQLYSIDVLASLREQVIEQTGYDPGPPPPRGDLDLEVVHDAKYIFA